MKIIKNFFKGVLVLFFALLLVNASVSEDKIIKKDGNESSFVSDYNIYAIDLPEKIDFAGEEVPLHIRDVRERLDRELLVNIYWQSNGLLLIKRAHKFFPIIEPILKQNSIPDDFKYLALIESGLQNVESPSGASGFWQFMKAAAQENGLEITQDIDERYNLEKSTKAACDYLHSAKNYFGSWTLAAAAYNAGRAGIKRQMDSQKEANYYDLHLNSETSRYVFRILALKEIMQDPKAYGFNYNKSQLYNQDALREVVVSQTIENLADFAKEQGTNYKTLRIYNPWLRSMTLQNPQNKTYIIKVPR